MAEQNSKENTSGKIRLNDQKIFWDGQDENILEVSINEIVIVGEFTNSDGPFFDDWFLTFVLKDGSYKSISCYAENFDELVNKLSTIFGDQLKFPSLAGSTDWNSVINYPTHLQGNKLFVLTPADTYKIPKTFIDKIKHATGFGNFDSTQHIGLAECAKEELTKRNLT